MMNEHNNSVFISYSRQDSKKVDLFAKRIKNAGIDIWIDNLSIEPADSIIKKINDGLSSSTCFVLFASQNYFESAWAQEEYHAAVYLALSSNSIKFVLILLDNVELPPLLAHKLYIKWDTIDQVSNEFKNWYCTFQEDNKLDSSSKNREQSQLVNLKDIQDIYIDIFVNHILDNLGDLVLEPESLVQISLDYSQGSKIILYLNKLFLENEMFITELKIERDIAIIQQRKINHYKIDLSKGGLGVLSPAFNLAYEDELKLLENTRLKLREQLSFVSAKLEMVSFEEKGLSNHNGIVKKK